MSLSVEELTCRELVILVTEYFEGTLPPADVQRFDQHLEHCPYCRTWLKQMRRTVDLLGELPEEAVDPAARDELLARFRGWKREARGSGTG